MFLAPMPLNVTASAVRIVGCYKKDQAQDPIQAAYQEGYRKAQEEAEKNAKDQREMQQGEVVRLMQNLEKQYQELVQEFQVRIPAILLTLLKKIWVNLEWDAASVQSMVDQILMAYAPGESPLEIYLSSTDLAMFEQLGVQQNYEGITFKEDGSLTRGDCLVKSRFGLLDARLETKFKRIEAGFTAHQEANN